MTNREIFWCLFDGHESNQDTFNRAWLDGFEVEKEKLYTVMEYELKLDDLLKSLTELGIDTDKLTIVEKSPQQYKQE